MVFFAGNPIFQAGGVAAAEETVKISKSKTSQPPCKFWKLLLNLNI